MNDETKQLIESEINNNKVTLFMKGNPVAPQCGFSMKVSQVLTFLMGEGNYSTVDVLSNTTGLVTYIASEVEPSLVVSATKSG